MKRYYLPSLLLAVAVSLGAQDLPLDFSIRLADLHQAAESGDDRAIPGGKSLLIDADIGSITVRADTADQFVAEVELLGGAWRGEDAVSLFRAYAVFEGLDYKESFSPRSPQRLQPGQHLLVLAQYLGLGVDYDETTPIAVVEGLAFRLLD